MEDIHYSFESFKNIQELIRFTDQKAGAILVFTGIILTIYEQIIRNISFIEISNCEFWNIVIFIFSLFTLISLFSTLIILIFKVLKPRLANNYNDNEFSLIYFEHIANMGKNTFKKRNKKIDEKKQLNFILDQIYEVSKIMVEKTKYLSICFVSFFVSCVCLFITYISIGRL